MNNQREFYYNAQLRNYLIQFCSIFADLRVQVGQNDDNRPRMISVPIYSGSKDRVVAAIKGENTQNKPIRLPTMSVQLIGLELAPERRKGTPNNRRNTYMPSGGLFPDDVSVVEQRMPVPYNARYELSVWASNHDQRNQIIEQILMLFNPQIQIQTSDEPFDWTKLTMVELTNVSLDENYPAGTERRIITTSLEFFVPIYISVPADVHNRYVKDINIRVGTIAASFKTSEPEDILREFDEKQIPYELSIDLSSLNIN